MPVDKLTGLVFYPDNDFLIRKFTGLKFEYLENLSVAVVDQFGNLVSGATITIERNGGAAQQYTLPAGELFELVEGSTDFVISAIETDTHIPVSPPQAFTFDGSNKKSVILEVRRAYYYRVRAVRDGLKSNWSNTAKLAL
ncbi:hypothetical protein [Marinoscillum furvescens]|uniref:Uncharacterized protein n=1 Tax=Marinoscillum furvescens DSM 4134 TaxID=1122208 RepID=A0A3D9L723_MARFU|nr:hypothetical protein [Marinoscillum furvescens]REE01100.1 hypothetical protein C7460_104120 [Marinoscillum furvescens DSM 4134]